MKKVLGIENRKKKYYYVLLVRFMQIRSLATARRKKFVTLLWHSRNKNFERLQVNYFFGWKSFRTWWILTPLLKKNSWELSSHLKHRFYKNEFFVVKISNFVPFAKLCPSCAVLCGRVGFCYLMCTHTLKRVMIFFRL